jgi:alkylation response protein AidB-like acyl-CoA dehydrogenase
MSRKRADSGRSGVSAIGLGIRALTWFASHPLTARLGLHAPAARLLSGGARAGFSAVGAAGRQFKAVRKLAEPARAARPPRSDLFDLTPTDEQSLIAETMQQVAAEMLRPEAEAAERAGAVSASVLGHANDLGLIQMAIPEALGGAAGERSPITNALIAEALAHGDMGQAVALLCTPSVANVLTDYGNAEQQAMYLDALVSDAPPVASLAVMEDRPLFDPFQPQVRVEESGSGLCLSGEKVLVPMGAEASLFVVAARAPSGEPGLYIVERGSEGLSIEAQPAMGLRAAGLARLRFDKVALSENARIGDANSLDYDRFIMLGRLAWCALAAGTARAVLDAVIPYANERVAFGEPISQRQSIAFMISNIGIETDGMRLTMLRAVSRYERGESAVRETQLARTLVARHGMQIGSDGVQILGGHGFVKEYPLERWYRDLRAAGMMEGGLCL